jgi:Tol biopolymer transport system component
MEIYLIDADGSNRTRLTDHPAFDFDPTWPR